MVHQRELDPPELKVQVFVDAAAVVASKYSAQEPVVVWAQSEAVNKEERMISLRIGLLKWITTSYC